MWWNVISKTQNLWTTTHTGTQKQQWLGEETERCPNWPEASQRKKTGTRQSNVYMKTSCLAWRTHPFLCAALFLSVYINTSQLLTFSAFHSDRHRTVVLDGQIHKGVHQGIQRAVSRVIANGHCSLLTGVHVGNVFGKNEVKKCHKMYINISLLSACQTYHVHVHWQAQDKEKFWSVRKGH